MGEAVVSADCAPSFVFVSVCVFSWDAYAVAGSDGKYVYPEISDAEVKTGSTTCCRHDVKAVIVADIKIVTAKIKESFFILLRLLRSVFLVME